MPLTHRDDSFGVNVAEWNGLPTTSGKPTGDAPFSSTGTD